MDADRAQQVHNTAELLFDEESVDSGITALAKKVEAECGEDFPLVLWLGRKWARVADAGG